MKMPSMTNMKLTKAEKKKFTTSPTVGGSTEDYPWGLSINLDDAALKKLDIDDLPEPGDRCVLHAVGKVTQATQSANEKKTDRSISIQIMRLALLSEEDGVAKGFYSVDKE